MAGIIGVISIGLLLFLGILTSVVVLSLSLKQIPDKMYGVVKAKYLPWVLGSNSPYYSQAFVPSWHNGIWTRTLKTGWRFLFLYKIWGKIDLEEIPHCDEGKRFLYIAQAGKDITGGELMVVEDFDPSDGDTFLKYASRGPLAVLGSPGYNNVFGYVLQGAEDRPSNGRMYLFHIKIIDPITIGSVLKVGLNSHRPDDSMHVPQMGIVTANVGRYTRGEGLHEEDQIVANIPRQCNVGGIDYESHDNFTSLINFIVMGGEMGLQREVIEPGSYFIHPVAFKVEIVDSVAVTEGRRAVLVSNIGSGADEDGGDYIDEYANDGDAGDPSKRVPVLRSEFDPRTPDGEHRRGILSYSYGPGTYFINPYIIRAIIIDTTPQLVEDTVDVVTREFYDLKVPISLRFKIAPEDAPKAIAVSGSMKELVDDTILPELSPTVFDVFSRIDIERIMSDKTDAINEIKSRMDDLLKTRFVKLIKFLILKPDGSGDPDYKAYESLHARQVQAKLEQVVLEIERVTEERRVEVQHQKALGANQGIVAEAELHKLAAPDMMAAIKARGDAMNLKEGDSMSQVLAAIFQQPDLFQKLVNAYLKNKDN